MILEIRTYRLHPGAREAFLRVMRSRTLPMLAEAGIRVLAFGPSLVDDEGHEEAYLVRAFDSLEQRERLEGAFYGGAAWREGPRAEVLAAVESYHTIVVDGPGAVLGG